MHNQREPYFCQFIITIMETWYDLKNLQLTSKRYCLTIKLLVRFKILIITKLNQCKMSTNKYLLLLFWERSTQSTLQTLRILISIELLNCIFCQDLTLTLQLFAGTFCTYIWFEQKLMICRIRSQEKKWIALLLQVNQMNLIGETMEITMVLEQVTLQMIILIRLLEYRTEKWIVGSVIALYAISGMLIFTVIMLLYTFYHKFPRGYTAVN